MNPFETMRALIDVIRDADDCLHNEPDLYTKNYLVWRDIYNTRAEAERQKQALQPVFDAFVLAHPEMCN